MVYVLIFCIIIGMAIHDRRPKLNKNDIRWVRGLSDKYEELKCRLASVERFKERFEKQLKLIDAKLKQHSSEIDGLKTYYNELLKEDTQQAIHKLFSTKREDR